MENQINSCPPPEDCSDEAPLKVEADAYDNAADAQEGEAHRTAREEREAIAKKEVEEDIAFATEELGFTKQDILLATELLLPMLKKEWANPKLTKEEVVKNLDYVGTCVDFLLDAMPMGQKIDQEGLKTLCYFADYCSQTEGMGMKDIAYFVSEYIALGVLKEAYDFSLKNNADMLEQKYLHLKSVFKYYGLVLYESVPASGSEGAKGMAMQLCMKRILEDGRMYRGVVVDEKAVTVSIVFNGPQKFDVRDGYLRVLQDGVTFHVDAATLENVKKLLKKKTVVEKKPSAASDADMENII